MKLKCNYCKFHNKFPRVKSPIRCPRCGNPYGQKPQRKLHSKKYALLAAALILILFPMVSALSLTFQDSSEFASYITCVGGTACSYVQSNNGGNSYVTTGSSVSIITNADPLVSTYWAGTSMAPAGFNVYLMDSGHNNLDTLTSTSGVGDRIEMIVSGGTAQLYVNDVLRDTSVPLTQNPSYVGYIYSVDDIVYGTTENKNIFGMPEQGYYIKKDMINPASSGFYFPNGTLVSSYNMTSTWGVGDNNASRTIQLKEWSSGNVAGTYTTTAGTMAGSIAWPIADDIINNADAPYGFYITTIAGSGKVSSTIPYVSSGASVAWDSTSYAVGQPATITYSISSGGYWDLSTYTYSMIIADVYGNVVSTQPVTTQTGSKSYTFASTDNTGVYYAELMATPIAGGSAILMNYATTELTSYIIFSGYVMNAETTAVIIPAYVNITQGTNTANITTSSVGWNSSQSWLSGTPITINTVASGYVSDTQTFTPISASSIALNISMLSTTPASIGISIGGIVRDTQFGNPVVSATVSVVNGSSYNTATTNLAGFYRVDDLVAGTLYNVWSSKTGYANSSVAQKLAVGV